MIVTLLGSSIAEGAEADDAYELGKRIGAASHILKNGCYGGTMAASARGCREAGGYVIGVGVEGHRIDRTGAPNPYNSEVIVKANVLERVAELLRCDLVIVLPGQVGTLSEMFSAWVSAIEGYIPTVLLVGPKLKGLLDYLTENAFLKAEHAEHISVFHSVGELTF
jgi:uncharacterized protein (TIGR00725 family)